MYIEEFVGDRASLILEAFQHPLMLPKRNPSIEVALKAILITLEARVKGNIAATIEPKLQHAYDMFTVDYGDHPSQPGPLADNWESALDDMVEDLCEPYQAYLSADWLGTNTIGCMLWQDGEILKFAASMGKEVYKQLSYGKTPAQTLANAGIVQTEVDLYLAEHLSDATNPNEDDETMLAPSPQLAAVIEKIFNYVGAAFDPMVIYADLELAITDDDILAQGAGARMGLDNNETVVLQLYGMDNGEDAAEPLLQLLIQRRDFEDIAKPEGKKARTRAAKPAEGVAMVNAIDPKILTLMKDHSGMKATELSKELGVSRGSFDNYERGAHGFAPSPDQAAVLRSHLVTDINGMLLALSLLDKTEAMAVS